MKKILMIICIMVVFSGIFFYGVTKKNDFDAESLYLKICYKTDYGYTLDNCNDYEKNFFIMYDFLMQVECGGIEAFFTNSYDNIDDAYYCFDSFDLNVSKQYLEKAMTIYPEEYVECLSDEFVLQSLNDLDEEYYDLCEQELNQYFNKYILENKSYFID